MSAPTSSDIEEIASAFESLVTNKLIPNSTIIRRPWNQASVRLSWIESNELQKNIIAHLRTEQVEFEGHAWKDIVQHDDVFRHWEAFEKVKTVPRSLPSRSAQVENAVETTYRTLDQVQRMGDLDHRKKLDLDDAERKLAGLQ